MEIRVTFRHVNPSPGLHEYAERKVQRLQRFAHILHDAHVILTVEKQRQLAEIQVTGRHLQVSAMEETTDLYSSLDLVLDKIERQIKKQDGKRKDRKNHRPVDVHASPATEPSASSGVKVPAMDAKRHILVQRVAVKPMSVDEAALQLEQGGGLFVLFRQDGTDEIAVLYRGIDGALRLLQAGQA